MSEKVLNQELAIDSVIARMAAEAPANLEFSGDIKRPEPSLDQARAEFASSVSHIAHTLFSKKYGPLVGTVTKTTVETLLKNGEENLYRAKGDATLLIQELFDRSFKPVNKKAK